MRLSQWAYDFLRVDGSQVNYEQMASARTIRPDELDELLTLYRMLNPDEPELQRDDSLHEQWQRMLRDESVHIVVVEHDNRLVASCILSITPNLTRGARPFGLVENVVTHEDYRQNGFGRRCLRKAIEIAEDRECYKIMLLTGSDKEWKHEFYESCGFDKGAKTGFTLDLRGR
ncbi:MAG: GNAT superfamily N-acetyltransferase [Natronomonas sp.]